MEKAIWPALGVDWLTSRCMYGHECAFAWTAKKTTTSKLRNIINLGTKNRKIPKLKGSEKSKKRKGDLHVLATRWSLRVCNWNRLSKRFFRCFIVHVNIEFQRRIYFLGFISRWVSNLIIRNLGDSELKWAHVISQKQNPYNNEVI